MEQEAIDLGNGNRVEVRGEYGLTWHHARPDNGAACGTGGWVGFIPNDPYGWDLVQREPLTVSPSLLCNVCGAHGWIRNGRWEQA